ncbi:hypothetical protein JW978_04490 [Candidatus Dojkabacteria bacterium]|nr:hypothetical protein [Candidatus Dojkabacteria bacterium]
MGFKVEINSILRVDSCPDPEVGKIYDFENDGSRLYFDDVPIWLIKRDWTAQAEIQIVEQTRIEGKKVVGKFKVNNILSEEESRVLTEMLKRMYGWE